MSDDGQQGSAATRGTYLRAFTFGHVRQQDVVARRVCWTWP
jgi:hypothetical protein